MTDAPALWPGMDPTLDNRVGAAWRAMWATTSTDEWVRLGALSTAARSATTPPLADRTIRSLIKTAAAHDALEVRVADDGRHREVRRCTATEAP